VDRSSTIELPDLNNSMDERAPARLMMEVTIITAKIVFRQIEAVYRVKGVLLFAEGSQSDIEEFLCLLSLRR
jgi:hypothetical protein